MTDAVVVAYCTCPDEGSAKSIATAVVREGLAACVNRLPGVQSVYFWDGRLQDDAEILLIIKTTADRIDPLSQRIRALHPYETPEVIAIPATGGNEDYLEWVRASVKNKSE